MLFSISLPLIFALMTSAAPLHQDRAPISASQHKANGIAADRLNKRFDNLDASSRCKTGESACIGGKFAVCIDSKFVLSDCGGGLSCSAVARTDRAGTSVTCLSSSTAGLKRSLNRRALTAAENRANGEASLAANERFKTLTPDSECTDGEDACINGGFSVCANGKFVTTGCAAGTECTSLPLLFKVGNVVQCTTAADKKLRLDAATSGVTARGLNVREAERYEPPMIQRDISDFHIPAILSKRLVAGVMELFSKAKRSESVIIFA